MLRDPSSQQTAVGAVVPSRATLHHAWGDCGGGLGRFLSSEEVSFGQAQPVQAFPDTQGACCLFPPPIQSQWVKQTACGASHL